MTKAVSGQPSQLLCVQLKLRPQFRLEFCKCTDVILSLIDFAVSCNNLYQRANRKVVCYKESSLWQKGTSVDESQQTGTDVRSPAKVSPTATSKKIFIRSPGIVSSEVFFLNQPVSSKINFLSNNGFMLNT
jgi:hypothetical protein